MKSKIFSFSPIAIFLLCLLVPIIYSFSKRNDEGYVASFMSNWLATMIGATLGVLTALGINRWQQMQQDKSADEKKRQEDQQRLKIIIERVRLELEENRSQVERLKIALGESKHARVDLWDWAITIVNSLSFEAYDDLMKSGLHQRLLEKKTDEYLYQANRDLKELPHMVKQAAAALKFYYGYGGGEHKSDPLLDEVKAFLVKVIPNLDNVLQILKI